jgi:regulator of sigma E protease
MDQQAKPKDPNALLQTVVFIAVFAAVAVRQPQIATAIVAFATVVFVHELGHFLVAKQQGMRVETFSIGFGPVLAGFRYKGTDFQVAAIPLGGFMKPAGEDPKTDEDVANAKPDEFMGRPWWSRVLVSAAGPAMNFIFPFLVFFLLYATLGRKYPWGPPQVNGINDKSGAMQAGIELGDLVLKVNGVQVTNTRLLAGLVDQQSRLDPKKPLTVTLFRKGQALEKKVTTQLNGKAGRYLMGVQVSPSPPPFTTTVGTVKVLTPAETAGFKKGDVVLSVDGQPLKDAFQFPELFAKAAHDPVPMKVRRGDKELELKAGKKQPVPEGFAPPELIGLVGLEFELAKGTPEAERESLSLGQALRAAWFDTSTGVVVIVAGLRDIVTGKMNVKESLGGPVAIFKMAKQEADKSWEDLVNFMCSISLTLGLMNLMPVPVLDGGAIVWFWLPEAFRRKPVSIKYMGLMQNVGLVMVGGLMLFALSNDLSRIFR